MTAAVVMFMLVLPQRYQQGQLPEGHLQSWL